MDALGWPLGSDVSLIAWDTERSGRQVQAQVGGIGGDAGRARRRRRSAPPTVSANAPRSCSAPSSRASEVIATPSIPQGTIHSNGCRSLLTFTASPCVVTPRLTCTPIEPIFALPGVDGPICP